MGKDYAMKRLIGFTLAALLIALLALSAVAKPPNVHYRDIRAVGMGGAGIATMNDFSATMYNPAQLVRAERHIDLINLQASLGADVIGMFDFYDEHQEVFDNWDEATTAEQSALLDDMSEYDDNWMGFGTYPQIGFSVPNFAIGAYGAGDVLFKADKGPFDPRVYMRGVADYVFTGGAAIELPVNFLPNKLYGGAALKIIRRYQVEELRLSASDVDVSTAYDTLVEKSLTGFGIDVGALYELMPGRMDLGLMIRDLVGSIDGDAPPIQVNVGASYHVSRSLMLAADFNDMFFSEGENMFNKLYFGGEYSGLGILVLRGGFGQGWPSAGAGLKLGILDIDAAVYGVEHSDHPGGDGDYNYAVRLKLGL